MSQTTILFTKEDLIEGQEELLLELDNRLNGESSRFVPQTDVFIRSFPSSPDLQVSSTMGRVTIEGHHIPLEVEEEIVFANTQEESLKYPASSIISWEWLGRNGGTPLFNGKTITLPNKVYGVLKVNYISYYDSIKLRSDNEGKVLVSAWNASSSGSIVIDYTTETKPVYLTVKDACTKTIIPGASVFVDGQFVGLTDNNGRIFLGELRVGEHQLKITAQNYQDSDRDTIANDKFIIR